ncbi:MAG: hypothetical protein CMD18_03875 [Flavobacteriales bacterium]|nr:hypothetical protein [Flavobacteriales bacterium]|tara:strand:- start:3894 stop:4397 length:504 start_codon:yes stop_codon:yes gene_type:complete
MKTNLKFKNDFNDNIFKMNINKKIIHHTINQELSSRIKKVEHALNTQRESLNTASESTAGDKHNTSRAMMHLEEDKLNRQLAQLYQLKSLVDRINPSKKNNEIKLGSLIETNHGYIYIAIPFGKIKIAEIELMIVSYASPISNALRGKKEKDQFKFKNQKWIVNKVC